MSDSEWVMWIIVGGNEVDKSDRHEPGYSAENKQGVANTDVLQLINANYERTIQTQQQTANDVPLMRADMICE